MIDKNTDALTKYDIKVTETGRARGGTWCQTDKGLKLLKQYEGNPSALEREYDILNYIRDGGYYFIDAINKNIDGELFTQGADGKQYVLRDWYSGHECDIKSRQNIYQCARSIAKVHLIMGETPIIAPTGNLVTEYERHNRELKRVRTFMRAKKRKNDFDINVLYYFDKFYMSAQDAYEQLQESPYLSLMDEVKEKKSLCHGNFNYHNAVFAVSGIAITNFEKVKINIQIIDLYNFLRKVMEKLSWNKEIGYNIINSYSSVKNISEEEMKILNILFLYPEKFWKLANHYYNSRKVRISEKNTEKFETLCRQEDLKIEFIRSLLYNN